MSINGRPPARGAREYSYGHKEGGAGELSRGVHGVAAGGLRSSTRSRCREIEEEFNKHGKDFFKKKQELLKRYVEDGHINFTAPGISSPIICAASSGDIDSVEYLINNGAQIGVYAPNSKRTALHCAIKRRFNSDNYVETITLLLESGANAKHVNEKGLCAIEMVLAVCVKRNRHDTAKHLIRLLIENGADRLDPDKVIKKISGSNVRVRSRARLLGMEDEILIEGRDLKRRRAKKKKKKDKSLLRRLMAKKKRQAENLTQAAAALVSLQSAKPREGDRVLLEAIARSPFDLPQVGVEGDLAAVARGTQAALDNALREDPSLRGVLLKCLNQRPIQARSFKKRFAEGDREEGVKRQRKK